MKKFISAFILIYAVSYSQWLPDFRLTNNPNSSDKVYNMGTGIAASGNNIFVVWYDGRDGMFPEIYFKRSTDGAATWSADQRLTFDPSSSVFPNVACIFPALHVCWQDNRLGTGKIFYKRSSDGGVSWGNDLQISFGNSSVSEFPVLCVNSTVVHAAYQDNRNGNFEIYYTRSTNAGNSFGSEVRLTNNSSISALPSITAFGSFVKIAWSDTRDGNKEIYIKQSSDSGATWGNDIRLTNDTSVSDYPSISSYSNNISVTWQDLRTGGWEIFYKRSTDNGLTWDTDKRLTTDPPNSLNPSVCNSLNYVHVTWQDNRDGNFEIYHKLSPDFGVTWLPDSRLTISNANSLYPSLVTSANSLNVCWMDDRDGNYEIYYKRNPTGNPLNISGITSEIPGKFMLKQNYPNPFNPNTVINFSIPVSTVIKLSIYDIKGREAAVLFNGFITAGTYDFNLDASAYPNGVYFCSLRSDNFNDVIKMVLIK